MSLLALCQWFENTAVGGAIRESQWWFPVLETTHTLGIILMVGTIAVVDLRLLGVALRREPVSNVTQQLLPWTWIGFTLMFVSGFLLVLSEAVKLYSSPFFRIKLVLLLLAGLNALVFHFTVYRQVGAWDLASQTPRRAKAAGLISLACWIGVIAAGRAIGYE
jgi:hypothetical protein